MLVAGAAIHPLLIAETLALVLIGVALKKRAVAQRSSEVADRQSQQARG